MKRLVVAAFLVAAPVVAFANASDKECIDWAKRLLADPAKECTDLCPQAKRFDHFDYRAGLEAAFASRSGLGNFLAYLGRSTIIGAGAEPHACAVRALLVHWGDAAFSDSLRRQSSRSKEQAIGLLDYSGFPDFKSRFPKTYSLASHE